MFQQMQVFNAMKLSCLTLASDQLDAHFLCFYNTFITVLYMFPATSCLSSGGQIVLIQHLVSSLSVSGRPVHRLRVSYRFADSLWAGAFAPAHKLSVNLYNIAVPSWSCSQAVSKPVWHIPLLCVQWKTPDDGQRNCPKHVELHSKINLRN